MLPFSDNTPDPIAVAYSRAGFTLLVTYAVVTTVALTFLMYFETVVRQSPPVIECAVPVTRHTPSVAK